MNGVYIKAVVGVLRSNVEKMGEKKVSKKPRVKKGVNRNLKPISREKECVDKEGVQQIAVH